MNSTHSAAGTARRPLPADGDPQRSGGHRHNSRFDSALRWLLSCLAYAGDGSPPHDADGRDRRAGGRAAGRRGPRLPAPRRCARGSDASARRTQRPDWDLHFPGRVRRPGRLGSGSVEVGDCEGPRDDQGPDVLGAAREHRAVPRRSRQRVRRRQLQPRPPCRERWPHVLQRHGSEPVAGRCRPHLGGSDQAQLPDCGCLARLLAGQ